jgi:WhiB family redox-sensing transcriptional regulator
MDKAACIGMSHLFLGNGNEAGKETTKREKAALLICQSCPVRKECYEYGLLYPYGVWGGKTEKERQTIRNRQVRTKNVDD